MIFEKQWSKTKTRCQKNPLKSINPDLTLLLFIGAKYSGTTHGLIWNYERSPIENTDENMLQIRNKSFCPTGNSKSNPV